MKKHSDVYVDLDGNALDLAGLDDDERRLVTRLRRRAVTHPDWCGFDNYWTKTVADFYDSRNVSRSAVTKTIPFKIAQDLSSRIGIAAGFIRAPDYRDELKGLMLKEFPTQRAFCRATGISEDLLSHVLAGRKDLSLSTLTKGLERIGYQVRILPAAERKQTG